MVAQDSWVNNTDRTALDRREGGPGNPWKLVSENGGMAAISGGGRFTGASSFGRNSYGSLKYQGTLEQGTPSRTTAQIMAYIDDGTFLNGLLDDLRQGKPCGCNPKTNDIRARLRCGDMQDIQNFEKALSLNDAISTGTSTDNTIADAVANAGNRLMWQEAIDAGLMYTYEKLTHLDISKTSFTTALNQTLYRCDNEFWAGADGDGSANAGAVAYTTDGGNTWATYAVNVFTGSDNVESIAFAGKYILAGSTTAGIAFASIEDIKNNVTDAFTLSSPYSTLTNYPNALAVTNRNTVWAVCNGGVILRSIDSGLSFSVYDNGATTSENLTKVVFLTDELGWAGGANGALVRYSRGAWSLVTLATTAGTITDAVTSISVAEYRSDEVFVGTDAGNVYRSQNSQAGTPTFTLQLFPDYGNGSIADLQFAGFMGDVLFVVQTNGSSNSRVLIDRSGGAFGADVDVIEMYTSPSNTGINSIAPYDQNFALTVGEVHETYAFVGVVQP